MPCPMLILLPCFPLESSLQALLTTRKGKKRFAMYDLTITLTWEGLWVEDNTKQVHLQISTVKTLS